MGRDPALVSGGEGAVAAGAGGVGQAHAQARSGMGPDAAADGDPPGPGRRARGDGRLERHSPRLETVRPILRQQQADPAPMCPPVAGVRPELARITVPAPTLSAYDAPVEGCWMATAIAKPPHLAADLKTLCLSTVGSHWRPLAEQAARQRQAPAD